MILFLWSGGTTTRPSSLSYFVLTCHWNEVLLNRNCLFYPASTHCVIKVKRFFAMYRLTAFYLCPYPTTYRRKTLFAQVQCSLLIYSTKDSKLVFQIKICFVWKLNDYIHEARLIISYKIGSQSVIKSTNLEMIPIWICSEKRPMITSPETNSWILKFHVTFNPKWLPTTSETWVFRARNFGKSKIYSVMTRNSTIFGAQTIFFGKGKFNHVW